MKRRPEYDARRTGQNPRKFRRRCGYTAEQVRDYIGIGTVQAVYKWERGDSFPALENFFALAELYDVLPDEILVKCSDGLHACLDQDICREPVFLGQYWILLQDYRV